MARSDGTQGPAEGVRPLADWLEGLVAVGFLVLLALAALAALAYARPLKVTEAAPISYTQRGALSYAAHAKVGPAYPQGRAVTGDPLFLKLVDEVDIRFAYRFTTGVPHQLAGTASLDAVLSSSTGWKRAITLQAPTRFSGDRTVVSGTLATSTLPALVAKVEKATQVTGNYTLTLEPHVQVAGNVGGHHAAATFSGPVGFSFSADELQPQVPRSSGDSAPASNPLAPKATGSITAAKPAAAYISFEVARISVAEARAVAGPGVVATILVLLGCALLVRRSRPADEATGIRSRYRDWMIPVARVRQAAEHQVVEVADMDALAAIAERYDRMILHEVGDNADTFSVSDDGILYRYVVRHPRTGDDPPDNVTPIKRSA